MPETYTLPINLAEARELLSEVVAGKESYIYQKEDSLVPPRNLDAQDAEPRCVYINLKGQPSCIAAQVLVKAGVPTWKLSTCEGLGIWSALFKECGTEAALCYLAFAQQAQDQGETWGKAREIAESNVHEGRVINQKFAAPISDTKTKKGNSGE